MDKLVNTLEIVDMISHGEFIVIRTYRGNLYRIATSDIKIVEHVYRKDKNCS